MHQRQISSRFVYTLLKLWVLEILKMTDTCIIFKNTPYTLLTPLETSTDSRCPLNYDDLLSIESEMLTK